VAAKGTVINSFRVAVVDDDENMRQLVKDILQGADEFSYAGSFSNGSEALNGLPQMGPDLVLMNIRLPDLNGIECIRKLKHTMPGLKIVMLSGLHDAASISASLQAGAVGYLAKPITTAYCLVNLRVAVCGATGLQPRSSGSESDSPAADAPENGARLTKRETEVIEGLAEGLLYKEIADKLGISFSAVHQHAHRIYQKFDVTNRTEAIRALEARRANWNQRLLALTLPKRG